jgi:hypothetical protein
MASPEPVRRDEFDHLEQRVTRLEDRVDSESGLRAMMDLDQSRIMTRLDAQDRLLQALADTQSDHTARLTRLEDGQQRAEVGQRQLGHTIGTVQNGIETILTLLRNAE